MFWFLTVWYNYTEYNTHPFLQVSWFEEGGAIITSLIRRISQFQQLLFINQIITVRKREIILNKLL